MGNGHHRQYRYVMLRYTALLGNIVLDGNGRGGWGACAFAASCNLIVRSLQSHHNIMYHKCTTRVTTGYIGVTLP